MMTITTPIQHSISNAVQLDLQAFRDICVRAQEHARLLKTTLPVSIVRPILRIDAQAFFAACRGASLDGYYWEIPSQQTAFVGIGAAAILQGTSLNELSAAWSSFAAINSAHAQYPMFSYIRTAFDGTSARDSLWNAYPAHTIVVPAVVYRHSPDAAEMIFQAVIAPDTDIDVLLRTFEMYTHNDLHSQEYQHGAMNARYDEPSLTEWQLQVQQAVDEIRSGLYEKAVLARTIRIETDEAISANKVLRTLRESQPTAILFAVQYAGAVFLGATPERLVSVADGVLTTMALAGSLPRGTTFEEDTQLAGELLNSEKNRSEHAIVASMIKNALTPLTESLAIPHDPTILKLPQIQHLHTPISALLKADISILDVVAAMHPTPAVGGFPREAALDAIRRIESIDRGPYAAPTGWLDNRGNGDIAVALRSALLVDTSITIFAGCGIVADSVPEQELRESSVKMQTMLHAIEASLTGE